MASRATRITARLQLTKIGKYARVLGRSVDDVLKAAEPLLAEKIDAEEFLVGLRAAARRPRREPSKGEPREGTKESRAIEMLRQPEGATVAQLMAEMNWLKHSTHGFFANLKRKRGLSVTSEKPDGGERVYRLG